MRRWLTCGAAALGLFVAGCGGDEGNVVAPPSGGKIANIAAPAGKDWTEMVTETADGGYVMGNPEAPVKLVEYGSFGCSHCAEFEMTGAEPLKNYVRSGRLSWEFRSLIIFPTDPAVSVLMRCRGADAYHTLVQQIYATQPEWMSKLQEWGEKNSAQLQAMSPQQRLKPLIQVSGLDTFFRQRGMPEAKIDSCLNDTAALGRVLEISKRGQELGVEGTPTFFLNGIKIPNAGTWDALEPQLKRALGE